MMVLPTYQSEFSVCDFPALAPLLQSFREALPHVVLIAVGQLLFFDNGFKLDPAASTMALLLITPTEFTARALLLVLLL